MDKYWELTRSLSNKDTQEVVQDFLLSLKLMNHSQGTIIQYRRFLEQFFGEIDESFVTLNSETIQNWFQKHQAHLKETTVTFRLSILSSFYTFCEREELLEKSPIKSRWFPRLPKPIPKYLEKGDIAKTRQQSEKTSIRNRAMMEFFLTSGCRVGEVHLLNRNDIDLENRTANVVGKGKKIRQVHFSEKCALLLEMYLDSCPTSPALFVTSTGERLGIRRIQKIVKKIGEDAELETSLHPHRLRHTFATELLAKGAELSFIGAEMGHSSLTTTQIYARLPKREVISLYRKYMG